jgi:hypothetical protein
MPQPDRAPSPRSGPVSEHWSTSEPANPGFERYDDIYRVDRPKDNQSFVFTGRMGSDLEGMIGCVDAATGKWRWRQQTAAKGRFTCIDVGETTLLEITGWPQEDTLAVRRLSDGAVLGHPWEVGRIWLTAISGRRVATVGEAPAADENDQGAGPTAKSRAAEVADSGHEVATARIYDEWGHLLRSFQVRDPEKVTGFRRGFALVCRDRTLILNDAGGIVSTLR